MTTEKTYDELGKEANSILIKWQPLLEKCGHLETLDEKLILANTLEKLKQKAGYYFKKDHTHSSKAGARLNAQIVAKALGELKGS